MDSFYCVPFDMFYKDTRPVFRRFNRFTNGTDYAFSFPFTITQQEAFVMALCALWVIIESESNAYVRDWYGVNFEYSCIRDCLGKKFIWDFDSLDTKFYTRKVGARFRRGAYVPVNYFNITTKSRSKLTVFREGSREYVLIKYFLDKINAYIASKFCSNDITGFIQVCANDIKKMKFDFESAEKKCKELYGFDFKEAADFFSVDTIVLNKEKAIEYKNVVKVRSIQRECLRLQTGSYTSAYIDGVLHTPLDNLPKEFIEFLHSSNYERMVKLYDVSDLYFLGLLTFCINYARDNKQNIRAQNLLEYENDNLLHPYEFANKGRLEGWVEAVKESVSSYLFSPESNVLYKSFCIHTVLDYGIFKDLFEYCRAFLDIVESDKNIYTYGEKKLNSLFGDIKASSDVYYAITKVHTDSLSFYVSDKYKTIHKSSIARNEIQNHKKVIFKAFVSSVMYAYNELLLFHAEESLAETFDRETLALFSRVRSSMFEKREKDLDIVFDSIRSMFPREFRCGMLIDSNKLEKEHSFNMNTICNIARGGALFEKVLPELKVATGCRDFFVMDDAIYCPESIAKRINTEKLAHEIAIPFIKVVTNMCSNLNSYFNHNVIRKECLI